MLPGRGSIWAVLIGRIKVWTDKRKALWLRSGNEERKAFHPFISSEQAWRKKFHWKNYRLMVELLKDGRKKNSQGIMLKQITAQDIMGRMGLYSFFFFFYPPSANCCLCFCRYYIKETKSQITCSWLIIKCKSRSRVHTHSFDSKRKVIRYMPKFKVPNAAERALRGRPHR